VTGDGTQKRSIQRSAHRGRLSGTAIAVIAMVVLAAVGAAAYIALRRDREIVRVDGSSTVYPITSAWAGGFNSPDRQVVVAFSGTGGGFAKFCRGETDLSDASRPIKDSETATCAQNGITGIAEFLVAYDGLSVVVPVGNTWAQSLTVRELCRIWTSDTSADACGAAGPHVTRWNELNASWPDQEINLFGPGTDSGTYDYFIEAVLHPYDTDITADFFASEDDNVLVQGIANEPHSLGYFGYAYVVENTNKIRPLAIDDEDDGNGAGPIAPAEATIKAGTYAPLSRPLFVYASADSLSRPVVRDFLRFGYSAAGQGLVAETGYVGLTPSEIADQVAKIPT